MQKKIVSTLLAAGGLAVLVALPTPGAAQRAPRSSSTGGLSGAWRSVYSDASVKVAIDTARIRRSGEGTYRVRLRWQYTTDQMIGTSHTYRTMIDQKLIDCGTGGIKPVAAQTYDANGKPVAGYDTPASDLAHLDWATRPPESSAGKAYEAVCGAIKR